MPGKKPARRQKPSRAKGAKPIKRIKARPAAAKPATVPAAVFRALGARDPDSWARSPGDGALERFVLLRALWMRTVEPGKLLARARAHKLVGPAVDRMLAKVDLADLDALVRLAQEIALRDVLTVLDDPADEDDGVSWGVFYKEKGGKPGRRLGDLAPDIERAKP